MSLNLTAIFKTGVLCLLLLLSNISAQAQAKNRQATKENNPDTTILKNCAKGEQVEKIIGDAISIGAPLYNSGYHLLCYRVYEWAGYKILYEYGKSCKDMERVLKAAIEKSHGDYSDIEKAWMMRAAFDTILGVPTQMGEQKKEDTEIERGKG